MPQKYDVNLIIDETGESVSVSGELSDKEVSLLETFIKEAVEVWQTDFIQTGEKGQLNINWTEESGGQVKIVLPDWSQVIVFLHKFRPILLQNEKTNFYKIHNLLAKKLDHPNFRSLLSLQHELFSGKTSQSLVQYRSNQVLLNSEKVLFDWLNSHEYHREEAKREFIEGLHQMLPLDASKVIFLGLLIDKVIASINVANLIRVLLSKQQEMKVTMKRP